MASSISYLPQLPLHYRKREYASRLLNHKASEKESSQLGDHPWTMVCPLEMASILDGITWPRRVCDIHGRLVPFHVYAVHPQCNTTSVPMIIAPGDYEPPFPAASTPRIMPCAKA